MLILPGTGERRRSARAAYVSVTVPGQTEAAGLSGGKLKGQTMNSEPSNHEANRVLRVLKGERLKYTVRVHLPDQTVVEYQTNETPTLKFFDEDRCLWLFAGGYGAVPTMKWVEGAILLVEENKP